MADNFGLKIGLEGEKEFKKSLPELILAIVDFILDAIPQSIGGIQSLASWLWNKVSGWISFIWDGIGCCM